MGTMPSLSEALRSAIDQYIGEHRSRSIASLARKSGLGYSTVRRLSQGEATPELSTVIAVLGAIKSRDEFISFLNNYFPQQGHFLDKHFGEDARLSDSDLDYYLRDDVANFIIHLCGTTAGSHIDIVEKQTGQLGLRKLSDLIEAGFIQKDIEGNLTFCKSNFAFTNFETFKKNNEIHSRIFDVKHLGTTAALIAHQTESISMEGLKLIKEAGLEYISKVSQIKRKYSGSIPFFTTLMFNVYDDTNISKEAS